MNRTHLRLVHAQESRRAPAPSSRRAPARPSHRPPGGRAAGLTALAAGLTLGLASGALATLVTHAGDAVSLLLPVAGAVGITIAAAFRSRAVAQRHRHQARSRANRAAMREQAMRSTPVLITSQPQARPRLRVVEPVATPTRRAA